LLRYNYEFMRALTVPALLLVACSAAGQTPTTRVEFQLLQSPVIQQRLETLPRKFSERGRTLQTLFHEAGCTDLTTERVPGSSDPNVICVLTGQERGTIVVGAHYDASHHGSGAVDDWSGTALLPSLYQSLANVPRRHRIVFIGFSAEEAGLVGSAAYVKRLSTDERASIEAMVNLECLGLGPASVWEHRADKRLLEDYLKVSRTLQLEPRGVNVERVGNDDSASFLKARIPVITFHSITQETWPILHSPRDQLSAIDHDRYYEAYHLIAVYLAYLDATLSNFAKYSDKTTP
jgi:hypothetical protein